jgi:hypothetical protein
MKTSDFLTILSLLLAALAILNSKERKLLLLKFDKKDFWVGGIAILIMHYFMAFDWLAENWLPWLLNFTSSKGIPAEYFAYLLAISIIGYLIYKINVGFFAKGNSDRLIEFYKEMIVNDQIDELVQFIERYHLNDLLKFNKLQKEKIEKFNGIKNKKEAFVNYREIMASMLKQTRLYIAVEVSNSIIKNSKFVSKTVKKYPLLLAEIIGSKDDGKSMDMEFVQHYINCLIENGNEEFIQELKLLSDSGDSILNRSLIIDIPIMKALLSNTLQARRNEVWMPIKYTVERSMKYDEKQKSFLKKPFDLKLGDEFSRQKIYLAITFFDYMVRESIYRDSGWHMWLIGYHRFVKLIIENMTYDGSSALNYNHSFNHYSIYLILRNIKRWLLLNVEINDSNRYIDICRCLSLINLEISVADEMLISKMVKIQYFTISLDTYFQLTNSEFQDKAEQIRSEMELMFLLKSPHNYNPKLYLALILNSWKNYDKEPFISFDDSSIVDRFEENVMKKLFDQK